MKTATAVYLAFCASSVYGFGNTFGVTPRSGSVALGMAGRNAQPQKSLLQATVEVNKYIDENKVSLVLMYLILDYVDMFHSLHLDL